MTRFEFYERYKLFIPITHIREFERDLYNTIHAEAWVERMGELDRAPAMEDSRASK